MNRSAMDIIIATSCTGTLKILSGRISFSKPSVRLLGVVVSVITEDPTIKNDNRIAIIPAILAPSLVMVSFHSVTSGSPGVRNRLNTTVIIKIKTIARMPFTI